MEYRNFHSFFINSPIFSITTNTAKKATTTITGGLTLDAGAFEYDYDSGITSIDSLSIGGGINFGSDAGMVSWMDMDISTTTAGIDMSYSAQLDNVDALTIYGQTDGNGNIYDQPRIGIGTSTPAWLLQVASTSKAMFAFSHTGAAANQKHWIMASMSGNFYIATSSDGYATSTVPRITILSTGKVGIGTTSPAAELSISGQCVDTDTGCADIAELYASSEPTETGDIVAVDGNAISAPLGQGSFVKKATLGEAVIGIVSSRPAMTIEGSALQFLQGVSYFNNPLKPAVALSGRVPVKVSLEGGEIRPGDRIVLSSFTGIGMRATTSGMTVGIALENFDGLNSTTTVFVNGNEFKTGKILVFVNLGYSPLEVSAGDLNDALFVDAKSGKIKSQYVLDMSDKEIVNVRAILSASGNWSLDENGKLVVREIETGKLKVGSPAAPSGITIYDEDTGDPYCIKMKAGQMVSVTGECGASQEVQPRVAPAAEVEPQVSDIEPPVITISGNNPAVINVGSAYSDLGASVADNISQNLGVYYKVDGVEVSEVAIDTSVAGTHTVTYFAADEAGNVGTVERKVIVQDTTITTAVSTDTASSTVN